MIVTPIRPHVRRGMVLPLVLVGMLLLLTMSVALQQAAWRASQGARTQWDAQRGLYSADASIVRAFGTWDPDSLAATPIGVPLVSTASEAFGWWTRTSLARTGTLTAIAQSTTQRTRVVAALPPAAATSIGDVTRVHRTVTRAIRLEPPSIPLLGAVTVLGAANLTAATIDGRDSAHAYDPTRDDCGSARDTASVSAVAGVALVNSGAALIGNTTVIPLSAVSGHHTLFDSGFTLVSARARAVPLPIAGPFPASPPWRATVIQPTPGVTLTGVSHYVGLLAVDGDLLVHGSLHIDGLLLVRGALDVTRGTLDVRGAVVIRDRSIRGSQLGAGLHVVYAPCLVGRALVAVATPHRAPYGVWNVP
ncbi:MAG: hypothetical protein ABMA00_07210 [Gemmatimonas sp.]